MKFTHLTPHTLRNTSLRCVSLGSRTRSTPVAKPRAPRLARVCAVTCVNFFHYAVVIVRSQARQREQKRHKTLSESRIILRPEVFSLNTWPPLKRAKAREAFVCCDRPSRDSLYMIPHPHMPCQAFFTIFLKIFFRELLFEFFSEKSYGVARVGFRRATVGILTDRSVLKRTRLRQNDKRSPYQPPLFVTPFMLFFADR